MLFSLLLVTLLGQNPPAPQVPSLTEAVQLADQGQDAEALRAFQARAAANPDDHQARLWIARLHERMGNSNLAEAVYRSVLLENPSSVDAMAGVGRALLARDETVEALEVLGRAEELAPQNDAVLTAIGDAHRQAGRSAVAIGYLERAFALSPTPQHRTSLENARLAYAHRVETRGFNEQFTGPTPDSNGGDLLVNYRVRETLRITARGQVQRKFGIQDERGGGGLEWRWRPAITFYGQALIGPNNLVLPEGDYLGGVEYATPQANWALGVRYFDFEGAWVSVVAPSVAWNATDRIHVAIGLALSATQSNTVLARTYNTSGYVRGAYSLFPRVWLTAGYAGGVEDFDTFSIDRIGAFNANTASVGVRLDLATLTSIVGRYDRQWRAQGPEMGRVTLSLAQRF